MASRPLRVALISTCALTTPPRGYGGTELVVAELARELDSLGHDVTVFATRDSTCVGARGATFDRPVWPPDDLSELRHASAAWCEIAVHGDFDVVHVHHAQALPFAPLLSIPTVATIHHDRVSSLCEHYAAHEDVSFVAISHRQAALAWEVPFRAVVHHGLDPDRYPEGRGGESLAFLGRFAPSKAPHVAIDAARRAGVLLRLGGDAHAPEREYFEREVAPRLGPGVEWLGELDHPRKVDLLASSRAMLFPIQWEEPFGLVMIESMLVGTPVVAFDCGAVSEIVDDGITGFVVHTLEEFERRIHDVANIDRRRCRAVAREKWSAARMAKQYVDVYRARMAQDVAERLTARSKASVTVPRRLAGAAR